MVKIVMDENQILTDDIKDLLNKTFECWEEYVLPLEISKHNKKVILEELDEFDKVIYSDNKIIMVDIICMEYENSNYAWGNNKLYFIQDNNNKKQIIEYKFL